MFIYRFRKFHQIFHKKAVNFILQISQISMCIYCWVCVLIKNKSGQNKLLLLCVCELLFSTR